jgi:hypothetical protein
MEPKCCSLDPGEHWEQQQQRQHQLHVPMNTMFVLSAAQQ